jgi:eukaryotic-like serine/threonine-protein kinase
LKANGKPLQTGISLFSVKYDGSKCSFELAVTDSSNKIGTRLFIGSTDGSMYALDALSGNLIWKFATGGIIINSPTVLGKLVIFGSADRNLYAVNAITGILEWKFYTGNEFTGGLIKAAPAVNNGVIYFSCENGKLYALDSTVQVAGSIKYVNQKWMSVYGNAPGVSNSAPTIANGLVYAGASDNALYAYDAQNGTVKWQYPVAAPANRSNPVVLNNTAYFFAQNSTVYAVNASSGALLWQRNTDNGQATGAYFSSPAVFNNTLYIASAVSNGNTNQVCAINVSDGSIKWFSTPPPEAGTITNAGVAVYKGLLYGASDNGFLYTWDAATGNLKWKYNTTDTHVYTSPAIANDLVYMASENGTVYALYSATGVLKWKNKISNGTIAYSSPCVVDLAGLVNHPGESGEQQ